MFNLSNYSTTCIYHTHVLMGLLLKKWHSLTHFTTFFCASSTLRTAERSWDPIWMSTPSIIRFSVLSFQPPTGKEGLTNSSKVFFSVLSAWLGNDISFLSPQTWPSPPRFLHKDWGQSARVWGGRRNQYWALRPHQPLCSLQKKADRSCRRTSWWIMSKLSRPVLLA